MPDQLPFATCDVFTQTRYSGNPLAIVEQADGLTTAQMQIIAREFNLSETIFVQTAQDPAHTAKVRIFFPTAEIPFAGHPTIGCACHLATQSAPEGDFETTITLEEQAGLVPVTVSRRNGITRAELTAPVLPHAPDVGVVPSVDDLAHALGLPPSEIGFGSHEPGLWQGGPTFLYVPVKSLEALQKSRPCEPHWTNIMALAHVDSAYVYTAGTDSDYRARMYSPTAGIPEDPATGSASAILAAQLAASDALDGDVTQLVLHQGVEMNRASDIRLTIRRSQGCIAEVKIGGTMVPVSRGRITPPA